MNKSIAVQQEAYSYNNSRGNVNSALNNSNSISQNFLKQGRTKEAIEIINETKPLLKIKDNSFIEIEFANTLSKVYEVEGLEQKAAQAKNEYEILVDSFNYNEQQKKLIEQAKNEFLLNVENKMLLLDKDRELNEQTIELLKKDQVIQNETIKRQQTITTLLIVGLTLIFILGLLLLKNNRQRRNNNKLLVLKSLRTQMNPHFIFNCLSTIQGMIIGGETEQESAIKMISRFSLLIRSALEASHEEQVSLKDELDLLNNYLSLEKIRFHDSFDYEIQVDRTLETDWVQLPPMLVQPFVENAVLHGMEGKTTGGKIHINYQNREDHLLITVSDNGPGISTTKAQKQQNKSIYRHKSLGMTITQRRLEMLNHPGYELQVEEPRDENSKITGTIITIKLPIS